MKFYIIGLFGSFLFLLKILIHVYIEKKLDKRFSIGPSGNFLNPVLFLPIFDDVPERMKALKKVGNLVYGISITLIIIYVIGLNLH